MKTMNGARWGSNPWWHNFGPKRRLIAVLTVCLGISGSAWAQDDPAPKPAPYKFTTTGEPVSMTVAMVGSVVVAAGFGLMLRTTGPCYCEPRTPWVVGGLVVVTAGVTMVWLGLRSRDRTVIITPSVSRHGVGALGVVRWGGDRKGRSEGS